jgi:hypothetical protein
MITKHTPKPWHVHDEKICSEVEPMFQPCKNYYQVNPSQRTSADLTLAASAPELLSALKDTLEELKHASHIVNLNAEVIETARAAIAKATQQP